MLDFFQNRKAGVKDFKKIVRSRKLVIVKPEIPADLYEKCPKCDKLILNQDLKENLYVCSGCLYHFRLNANKRIEMLVDDKTFESLNNDLKSDNPLAVPGYGQRLENLYASGLSEAVVTGTGKIKGYEFAIAVMDSSFLMGSMGAVVGEKIVRLTEYATGKKLPLLIFNASGGARMQEGILSLMQMAKTTAAIKNHSDAGLLYISVLTDPTYGGVSASFATVADVIIAEPEAMVGFAGQRVIKQTINQVLPDGFQSSEFLLEHGLIDMIVARDDLSKTIGRIRKLYSTGGDGQ